MTNWLYIWIACGVVCFVYSMIYYDRCWEFKYKDIGPAIGFFFFLCLAGPVALLALAYHEILERWVESDERKRDDKEGRK